MDNLRHLRVSRLAEIVMNIRDNHGSIEHLAYFCLHLLTFSKISLASRMRVVNRLRPAKSLCIKRYGHPLGGFDSQLLTFRCIAITENGLSAVTCNDGVGLQGF